MADENSKITQERSPRFPAATLKDCIENIEKLYGGLGRSSAPAEAIAKALGYTGLSGASRTTIAAITYYGLIIREGNNLKVSDLALRIIRPVNDSDKARAIEQAHLEPKLFAQIQQEHPDCSESVLSTLLIHKDFTEDGAKRAARVYKENTEFLSQFSHLRGGPEKEPDPKTPEAGKPTNTQTTPPQRQQSQPITIASNELPVPIGDNLIARIPFPMSEEDFELFIGTLNLWKRKLVKKPDQPLPGSELL